MKKSSPTLTKLCIQCGQRKPLSAFLQLSESQGAIYGDICLTCRKANQENPKIKEKEESTSSTTGFKIDSKSKTHDDIDKRQKHQNTETLYHQERDEKKKKQLIQEQKIQIKAKEEKKHRQSFLTRRPFLDKSNKPSTDPAPAAVESEQQIAKEKIDLTTPMLDTQIIKEKYIKSPVFNQFKTWLGTSAPISRAEQIKKDAEKGKESLTEFVQKNWGPKKGGR